MFVYVYIYIYMFMYVCTNIYDRKNMNYNIGDVVVVDTVVVENN